jgi:hypothetical protein
MRGLVLMLLTSGVALGQTDSTNVPQVSVRPATVQPTKKAPPGQESNAAPTAAQAAAPQDSHPAAIPAGSRIPLLLKQAISTKNAREGDSVYAETAFPFVVNERVLVPAGTYIQGKISHVERAGRVKGRAELLMHFTTMIYPSGYTIILPGAVENMPGSENTTVKDKEGTIQQDKTTGKKVEDAAKGGAIGTVAGATAGGLATGGLNGARVGAGIGAAAGVAWALLRHGPDVRLAVGTSIEMEVQREIPVDIDRIHFAKAGS